MAGRPNDGGFLGRIKKDQLKRINSNSFESGYIEQPVDHFNESDKRTYQQAFYSNNKYYKTGGPIFLYIGGEGAESGSFIDSEVPLTDWAKRYNAMLYAVEHRFYGSSQPTSDMSVENLKYLTSEQALADLATFAKQVNKDKGYKNPKWIPYGGSYAGSLTSWFREIYPDVTFAAIGSSGPVQADVDFYGYLQTVEKSLRSHSDDCADNLKKAFDEIHRLFTTYEGRTKLNKVLQVTPPFNDDAIDVFDAFSFFSDLMGGIMSEVQYSDNYDGGVQTICAALTDKSVTDPVQRLQNLRYDSPTYHNFNDEISWFKYDSDTRAWFWQTCNEFGFYQSSDIGYNAFGSALPVNYYIRWCTDAYDSSLVRDKLEVSMDATNQVYGGARNFKSTRVIQLYGTVDPWHSIGLYPQDGNMGEDVLSILINGTSHCSDMNIAGDEKEINKALKTVITYLDKWLK